MTIALLASVSLFALVVTGRPVLSDFAPTSSTLQTAVQAAFRVHPGQDDLKLSDARFQAQKPEQQIEYPSEPGAENVAAVASFEALLDGTTGGQDAFNTPKPDDVTSEPIAQEPVVHDPQEAPMHEISPTSLAVLAFSCVAAFLALVCVALTLYIINSLRSQTLASMRAWDLLPRFWMTSSVPWENTSATAKGHFLDRSPLLFQTEVVPLLRAEEESAERHNLHTGDEPLYFDAVSDMESEWDVDEKYQDALDVTPLPLIHDLPLPLEERVSPKSHFGDPPLPSLESYPPDQPRVDPSPPLMREVRASRPAWSVRAIDSPALGLSTREGEGVDATPQPLIHSRRRAYRAAVPEFDIALAMQLRPGLGISADSAWMVRFLMAMFGWFAVALTGHAR